jgi:5-methylcytosine-specific restriction endonuclease McrA
VEKACSKCGEVKPLGEFPPDKRKRLGVASACRQCYSRARRRNRARNPGADRRYYLANRERILERQKRYHAKRASEDPDFWRKRGRRDRERDPEGWAAYQREYREKTRARRAAVVRKWHADHPGRIRELRRKSQNKRRARIQKLPYEDVDLAVVFERDGGICGICEEPVNENWHLDHIIPLAAGGSHVYENVQVAHPRCNLRKGARVAA